MGAAAAEVNGGQPAEPDPREQLEELVGVARQLRSEYEQLLTRVDAALGENAPRPDSAAASAAGAAQKASGMELLLRNLAVEGYDRAAATAYFVESCGEEPDTAALDAVYGPPDHSGVGNPRRRRRRFLRRGGANAHIDP